jgi:hypothetical protein
MRRFYIFISAIVAVLGAKNSWSQTPYSYTGGTYTNNFDGLPTDVTNAFQTITGTGPFYFTGNVTGVTNMDGWQLSNPGGSSANTEFRSQDGSLGSSSGRGVISFGANGSTNRALGTLATSNQVNDFGMVLVNNSTTTFTQFTLSYTGEVWRIGDATPPDALTFAYGPGAGINDLAPDDPTTLDANLDFHGDSTSNYATVKPTVPAGGGIAVDGTNAINQTAVSDTVTGISWAPGQTFILRWLGENNTGQDDGLAIDNLSFSFSAVVQHIAGDFNFDGHIDAADVLAMEKALANWSKFESDNSLSVSDATVIGDVNGDGKVNNADLQALLGKLAGGVAVISSVPEPAALLLAALGGIGLAVATRLNYSKEKFGA